MAREFAPTTTWEMIRAAHAASLCYATTTEEREESIECMLTAVWEDDPLAFYTAVATLMLNACVQCYQYPVRLTDVHRSAIEGQCVLTPLPDAQPRADLAAQCNGSLAVLEDVIHGALPANATADDVLRVVSGVWAADADLFWTAVANFVIARVLNVDGTKPVGPPSGPLIWP